MSSVRVSAPRKQKIKPAFTVTRLEGERVLTVHSFDQNGKRVAKDVKVPAGYLVKFLKGHSIRVANDADLKRLGFDRTIELVDDEGNVHGEIPNDILKGVEA